MVIEVKENADGLFEIVRLQPEILAIVADKSMAHKIAIFIGEDEAGSFADDPAGTAPAALPPPAAKADGAPTPAAKPSPSFRSTSSTDWEAAFIRIAKGETVKAVAADIGVPFPTLRGKWAPRAKEYKARFADTDKPADGTVAMAPALRPIAKPPALIGDNSPSAIIQRAKGELGDDAQTCALCKEPFKPTPDSLDHCARCRGDNQHHTSKG